MIDSTILDSLISGRVDPHIYGFSTNTVPNYLKVGDSYRPVRIRLNEWKRFFPDLTPIESSYSARIDDNHIFRDYAVHDFLIRQKQRERLRPDQAKGFYYSNEFFKEATETDIREAIEDIRTSAANCDGRYQFYGNDRLPVVITPERDQDYDPRKNQSEVIERFKAAVYQGRKNLLMYAVMRFGKTFTAMCCADEIAAHFVVIVSAKADVCKEWQGIVMRHKRFAGYVFLDRNRLDQEPGIIPTLLTEGKHIALFLTLQDLQGEEIKERHQDVFAQHIDLLIIDETHFGARAEEYGRVLRTANIKPQQLGKEMAGYDDTADFLDNTKKLGDDQTIRLHLSGTPYRILMGDEFGKEDIIAFVRFADIVDAQKKWDTDHFMDQESNADGSEIKEWDNPYFGFPQMIRFAFHPSQRARQKLHELKSAGVSFALSALFRPESLTKNSLSESYRTFKFEAEILDLFKAIDGTNDDANILGFLNDSRIKDGKMCRHIVCVLPYRTSCDALAALLKTHSEEFSNWQDYKVINVAGYDTVIDNIDDLRHIIEESENNEEKTLTLTVNRFLTGSTVEQWDTMLYFKDTASPQEYDQAIFRLQNPFIKTLVNGDQKIRINMKPQTLLVDFDPDRMFRLQELKSLFYNTNTEQRGNDALRNCIERELLISPIIAINCDKMCEITPQNIIDAVRNYNADKSILDEAVDLPFDSVLLEIDDLKEMISRLKPLKDRKGIELEPQIGDGTDLDVPLPTADSKSPNNNQNTSSQNESLQEDDLQKQLAAYYMRILFYAFLTEDEVTSLKQIIDGIDANDDNVRISQHVGIEKQYLQLIFEKGSEFKLSNLDCTIENVNALGRDESLAPIERAKIAMRKLSRISESEVVTPERVASDLVDMVSPEMVVPGTVVLDLSSKQGELAYAFHNKYHDIPDVRFYSVATSKLTYELTRKVYRALELPEDHVLNFTSFSLIGENSEAFIERITALSPSIVFSAPPYNKSDGGGRTGSGSGSAIYQYFFDIAVDNLSPQAVVMYLKSNWYSGGRGDGLPEFRERMLSDHHISVFHDYPDPKKYIDSDVNLRGGVCTFIWERKHDNKCKFYNHINDMTSYMDRYLLEDGIDYGDERILIRYNKGLSILHKVQSRRPEYISGAAFSRNPFKLQSNVKLLQRKRKNSLRVYLPKGREGFIYTQNISNYTEKKELINSWKVLVAKASPGEDALPHAVISTPIVSEPGSLCTDSHLIVRVVENQNQAENLAAYMKTRFFRFMMILAKNGQNMTKDTFRFVPVPDLGKQWTDEQLYEFYGLTPNESSYIQSIVTEPRA